LIIKYVLCLFYAYAGYCQVGIKQWDCPGGCTWLFASVTAIAVFHPLYLRNAWTYVNETHYLLPAPHNTDDSFEVTGSKVKLGSDGHGHLVNSIFRVFANRWIDLNQNVHKHLLHLGDELSGFAWQDLEG